MPQRTNAFAWFGPRQPIATSLRIFGRSHFFTATYQGFVNWNQGVHYQHDKRRQKWPNRQVSLPRIKIGARQPITLCLLNQPPGDTPPVTPPAAHLKRQRGHHR